MRSPSSCPILFVACAVSLVSCAESPVPVQEPTEAEIDARLLGTWTVEQDDPADAVRIRILPFDGHQMVAEVVVLESINGGYEVETELYRVVVTDIEGSTWISADELDESDLDSSAKATWYIARLDFQEDRSFQFRELTDSVELEEMETVEDLRTVLREHRDDPALVDEEALHFVPYEQGSVGHPAGAIRF